MRRDGHGVRGAESRVDDGEGRGALPHGEAAGLRGGEEAGTGAQARGGRRRPARACTADETDAGVVKVRRRWRNDQEGSAGIEEAPRRQHVGGA